MNNIIIFIICAVILFIGSIFYAKHLVTKSKSGQPIYNDGPKWHAKKSGTPTKGGKIFVIPLLIIIGIMFILTQEQTYLFLFVILGLTFFMGLIDDNNKINKKDNQSGLSSTQKLLIQFIIALILDYWFYITCGYNGIMLYICLILIPLVMMGLTNATNLTDGLDGLLGFVSLASFFPFLFISILTSNTLFIIILSLFLLCLCVFLFYNKYPAKIFMGDTGSLVIGAFFMFNCIYFRLGWLGLLLGGIYIIEMFSVILQVTYFRYTKKKYGEGKRLLKMAPLHHHFEKMGISEVNIDYFFSGAQIIISTLVLLIYMATNATVSF